MPIGEIRPAIVLMQQTGLATCSPSGLQVESEVPYHDRVSRRDGPDIEQVPNSGWIGLGQGLGTTKDMLGRKAVCNTQYLQG